jgi:hypothetical protein
MRGLHRYAAVGERCSSGEGHELTGTCIRTLRHPLVTSRSCITSRRHCAASIRGTLRTSLGPNNGEPDRTSIAHAPRCCIADGHREQGVPDIAEPQSANTECNNVRLPHLDYRKHTRALGWKDGQIHRKRAAWYGPPPSNRGHHLDCHSSHELSTFDKTSNALGNDRRSHPRRILNTPSLQPLACLQLHSATSSPPCPSVKGHTQHSDSLIAQCSCRRMTQATHTLPCSL